MATPTTPTLNEKLTLQIPFPTARLAKIAADVLKVDKDLKPEVSQRIITTDGPLMTIEFHTSTLKLLRTVVNSTFEMIQMVVSTMEAFDVATDESSPPVPSEPPAATASPVGA